MKPPQAIFFDLDETLLDDDRAYQVSVGRTSIDLAHQIAGVDPHALRDTYFAISDRFWSELGLVRSWTSYPGHDGQSIRTLLWTEALATQGVAASEGSGAASLFAEHRRRSYVPFDDVVDTLTALRRRLPLAVITNGFGDTQKEKLHVLGIDHLFAAVFASGEVGIGKPDPAIFRLALDKLGFAPQDVWHVGDSLASDIAGAQAAGLTAVWLNRPGRQRAASDPAPDLAIRSLVELTALIAAQTT